MNSALIKLQRKGQMVIPRRLREQAGVPEGTVMEVAVVEGGRFLITPQVTLDRAIATDPKKSRKQLLRALSAAVEGIRREAKESGVSKLTMRQIDAEVASRRGQPKKRAKQPGK